jgi:tetratricopeptide (TPR) repeat protein
MLILLDNFEHLLEGASLAAEVVQAAPGVRIIVTSREPLRLLDEQLFTVHGLDFPEWETPEDALEYDAARLFLSSARRSRSEFDLGQGDLQPMTRICRLVQGMPLGIVLAAGWVELLSPVEIAEELGQGIDILESDLHDIPERQRSMRAVFDTTWEQLNRRERDVLMRLSVFRGGCSQQAIRQVTGATLMELKSLTGKSLINTNRDGRHEMHELLGQYAADKLERGPDANFEAHDRHCSYYLDSIAELEGDLYSPRVKRVMNDIDGDLENVQSALRWAATHQQVERLDRAINPLFQYYRWRDRHNSIFRDAQIIIEGLDRVASPEARLITARALSRQGWFLPDPEDLELVMKSAALLRRNDLASLDTRKDRAFTLARLGGLTIASDPQRSLEISEESLVLFREVGDLWGEAAALNNLARYANIAGNLEEEKRLREKCKIIYEQMGNPIELAQSLTRLGWLASDQFDVDEAQQLARQSYNMLVDVGYPSSVARSSLNLGRSLYLVGRFDEALERIKDAWNIYEDLGYDSGKMLCIFRKAWTYSHIGEYESASSLARQSLSYYEPIGNAGGTHWLLAGLALKRKDPGEVRSQAQKALEIFRANHYWLGEHGCLVLISRAERLSGNESASRHHFIEALRIITAGKELGFAIAGLPAAALLFADQGEVERAVEIYELACQRPFVANSQWYEDVFGKHIAAMAESLPPEVVDAARQRGRERDPWETAKEILAELEAEDEQG